MDAPRYSVVIARVATEDRARLSETLAALATQDTDVPFEVVVVDRTAPPSAAVDAVRWLRVGADWTIPRMRAFGVAEARAPVVVVTEDHCIPASDWLRAIDTVLASRPGIAILGGCVLNGLRTRAFDWAAFLSEYAALLPPFPADAQGPLGGMNTAYRRDVLLAAPRELLEDEFWELGLHDWIVRRGYDVRACDRVSVEHRKRFSVRLALSQRYAYSRHHAARRAAGWSAAHRLFDALARLALPGLLAWRLAVVLRGKRLPPGTGWRAAPGLLAIFLAWTAGEIVGTLAGGGGALQAVE